MVKQRLVLTDSFVFTMAFYFKLCANKILKMIGLIKRYEYMHDPSGESLYFINLRHRLLTTTTISKRLNDAHRKQISEL